MSTRPELRTFVVVASLLLIGAIVGGCGDRSGGRAPALKVGVARVPITPCGANPDWDGPTTASGVWGEEYTDTNQNGRYDVGEPFTDDPRNDALDPGSRGKYDGIYMAGFGNDRVALGCHDDLWARALILDDGKNRVAITVVDMIGMLKHGSYYGFAHAQAMLDPALGVMSFIFASTHDHEGPDALGLWGPDLPVDGKFPLYLTFVDRQVARAIREAVASLEPVSELRAMRTDPAESAALRGLQVRTGCRPPWVFDDELRGLSFATANGKVKATLINWGTHPESLESENTQISSDFINYIRDEVESRVGGTAVYLSADLGAVEITGDTCVGGADARNPDGTNEFDTRDDLGFPRTERIGRAVGGVAAERLLAAAPLPIASLDVASVSYQGASSNPLFELGRSIGILDLDPALYDPALCPGATGLCAPLEQHVVTLRDAGKQPMVQMVTVPGELFPELYLGVATHRRTDCPAADTGLPPEPSIRNAMAAPYRLVIGLSPDEIGYVVPGYDFYPGTNLLDETPDPCDGQPYDPAHPRRRVPTHYHETLSVGVEAASIFTCHAVELLAGSGAIAGEPACTVVR